MTAEDPDATGPAPEGSRPERASAPYRVTQRILLSRASLEQLQPSTLLGPGFTDRFLAQALRRPAAVLVSFPRAGRTWLRVMLAHAFERIFRTRPRPPVNIEAAAATEPRVPRVVITSGYLDPRRAAPEETARNLGWSDGHRIVLLARDPRDIAVSLYFDRSRRARHFRDALPYDGSLQAFLRESRGGLRTIVAYYNAWAAHLRARADFGEDVKLVKYEHLHDDAHLEFGRLLTFLRLDAPPGFVDEMVRGASFDAVRALETSGSLGYTPTPDMVGDERSLVLRRGVPGGYMDHFMRDDHEFASEVLADLNPWYAYTP